MKKLMKCGALLLAAVLALTALGGCAKTEDEPKNTFVLPDGLVAPTLTPKPRGEEETPAPSPAPETEVEPESEGN